MASSERYPVSVKINFRIQDDKSITQARRTFDASNCEPATLGLSEGRTPTKPDAGDYSYSGMHDHGPLPPPIEGGDVALLIGCVDAAKRCSDEFLTNVIKKEKARSPPKKAEKNRKRAKK
jgi:hypothetical protein